MLSPLFYEKTPRKFQHIPDIRYSFTLICAMAKAFD